MKTNLVLLLSVAALGVPSTDAASVAVVWYNNIPNGTRFKDRDGNYLTAGTSLGGDGAILQLGYYTGATQAAPFVGTWVPLTGPGTGQRSTIGDSGGWLGGTFNLVHYFKGNSPEVPAIGTPLAIRFYDTTSLATANYFNCVSNTNGTWSWILGNPEPTLTLSFTITSPTQVWQGGAGSAFRTTIPVPEPGVAVLLVGGALLVWRRRRGANH